jgi:hypothetical protein
LLFLAVFTSSCALIHTANLKREEVTDINTIKGTYTLILFGNRHGDDMETIAFLDSEKDTYTLEPFAPEYDYTVKKHYKGSSALDSAISFVRSHENYKGVRIIRITDGQGGLFGYEVRPLYRDMRLRTPDVLDVSYVQKDDKVLIYIRLKTHVEKFLKRDRLEE